ncbi:fibronectin type III domain-containing protein [Pseudobacillus sp. 179-B 2D1 NHS]|uniref:fibronectin type III domain-containing protein n=1 Tax=Pseudobacillus sp. 179-B 2D1 NHS TaxID=3374292 RepID=UPI00387913C5
MDLKHLARQQGSFLIKKLLPNSPANLTAGTPTVTTVTLTWDAVSGASYRIYRNNTQIDTSETNSYKATGLTTATTYDFEVTAVVNGDESVRSNKVTVTTE